METLLFVICAGVALYGFFMTTLGRDLLTTGLAALRGEASASFGAPRKPAPRQRFSGRDTFGQRGR